MGVRRAGAWERGVVCGRGGLPGETNGTLGTRVERARVKPVGSAYEGLQ